MPVELIITEKGIAGQRIAQILSDGSAKTRAREGAQVFDFSKPSKDVSVVPLRGHIVEVDFPRKYSYWIGTDLRELVHAPIDYNGTEPGIIALLKKTAGDALTVIIATDNDREGEAIGVEALRFVQQANPKIEVKRAYFSAIATQEIRQAFRELTTVDFNMADSADARREIDLVWGAVLTRFVSIVSGKMGKEFLSVGRVQTPVLALIVDREKERLAFKPQKYWELIAHLEKDAVGFEAFHKQGRFLDEVQAKNVFEGVKDAKEGVVENVSSRKRVLARPLPFNTTEFLRAATVLGLSAGQAMGIAENLYMQGFISYPRTDNTVYPRVLNLKEILSELGKTGEFYGPVQDILARGELNPSRGSKESKDHPPIHPVAVPERSKTGEREWKVFELVARRFLATLSEDAETLNVSVDLFIKGQPFAATGQTITKSGWKAVYPYSVLKEVHLPKLEKGDLVKVNKVELLGKETLPPARYSQSALLKLMDEKNLGTKSTRHTIIQKLYARKYISGLKSVEPNAIAFAVIDALEKYCKDVTEPRMTAELEGEMDGVAAGKKSKNEVVEESRKLLEGLLQELLKNKSDIGSALRKALQADSMLVQCPACKTGQLMIRKSKFGKRFVGCSSYPNCTTTFPLPQKGTISPSQNPCKVCGKPCVFLRGARFRLEMCLDMNCPSKDEWKKRSAEKKAKAEENATSNSSALPVEKSIRSGTIILQKKPRAIKASRAKKPVGNQGVEQGNM
ncbi:MAG: DNA topoisomerase I [Candidatus Diapherotrites archaeon]|nr:DNA topoisomerase I [Candidatus Diapherotrites archaeon]